MAHDTTTIDPAWQARMAELVDAPHETLVARSSRLAVDLCNAVTTGAPGREAMWAEYHMIDEALGRQSLTNVG